MGCPIRRSRDHRSLASPPGFSQRATSFIASQCQGIHQMPFNCSIQGIVSTPMAVPRHPNPAAHRGKPQIPARPPVQPVLPAGSAAKPARVLLRARRLVHEDTSSDGPITRRFTPQAEPSASVTFTNSLHPINQHPPGHSPATRPTAPDVKYPGNRSSPNAIGSEVRSQTPDPFQSLIFVVGSVEVNGIEPMTSCLQSRRSPN